MLNNLLQYSGHSWGPGVNGWLIRKLEKVSLLVGDSSLRDLAKKMFVALDQLDSLIQGTTSCMNVLRYNLAA